MRFEEVDGEGTKGKVRRVLDNHWLEIFVLILVLIDVALVSVEAGIDHNLLCIGGKVVPYGSPAGEHMAMSHHAHGHSGEGPAAGHAHKETPHAHKETSHDPGHSHGHFIVGEGVEAGFADLPAHATKQEEALGLTYRKSHLRLAVDPSFTVIELQEGAKQKHEGSLARHDNHLGHSSVDGHPEHRMADVLVCESKKSHRVHHIMHTCHFWSICILVFFCVELLLKWWAFPGFLDDHFHKLDMFVVFSSLLVDTAVVWYIRSSKHSSDHESDHATQQADFIAGLLLVTRVWRVVRIIHGLYEFEEKQRGISHSGSHAGGHGEDASHH